MTSRGGGRRPAVLGRVLAAALALALPPAVPGTTPPAQAAPPPRNTRVPIVFHKSKSFRIPFNVDPADQPRLKEVRLLVSEDSGFTWKTASRTTPDRPAFTFRAARDAEYWFAVLTVDGKGQVFPKETDRVEPSMKVIVDTTPPSLVLENDGRRGSLASVRWEVRDEHLDLKSLLIEYQVEGAREWREVPIRRPALIGSESWDAGTAEGLKIRASVSDRAGNVAEAQLAMPEGTPVNPALVGNDAAEYSGPPPVSQISSGPTFPPRDDRSAAPFAAAGPGVDPFANSPSTPAAAPAASPAPGGDPFAGSAPSNEPPGPVEAAPAAAPAPAATPAPAQPAGAPGGGSIPSILVPNPRFPLQYEVENAGPNGPATVELWVTQNGGRTWFRRGEDPDKTSPFPAELGGEGTFGLRIVSRGASGLGDQTPAPGDPPHLWVEVDGTAPVVQLFAPMAGQGQHLGKVAVLWRASDVHLGPAPVKILWRPADQPGTSWQPVTEQPVENTGKFIWNVPVSVPPRFHLRVEVEDTAGNRGWAETSEGPPVVVDRARPRSRIIGLDPSARSGMGPTARPLR